MKKNWFIFLVMLLLAACSNQRVGGDTDNSTLKLAPSEEPGTLLTIKGKIIDQQTKLPVPGAEIYFYQADDGGNYSPADPADEFTARLHGMVWTDNDGKFTLHTILPGEYDDAQTGNRHIHIESIQAAGYQEKGGLILFDHNVNASVRAWAFESGFGYIIEVKKMDKAFYTGSWKYHWNKKTPEKGLKPSLFGGV